MEVKNKQTVKTLLSRYALPLLYGFVIMKLILSTYTIGNNYLLYFGFAAYECFLFFIFEKIKPKKIFRGFVYIGLFIIVGFAAKMILDNFEINTKYNFIEWFYLNVSTVGEVMPYIMSLFLILGYFIVSIIYYFTIIRYRTIGILIATIFPFAIYGKRDQPLTAFDVTLMLTVFLALMVHARQVSDDKRKDNPGTLIINNAYLAAVAIFVTFIGAVTMIAPKPEIQSRLEQNKELFNFNIITVQKTDYDDYTNQSSPRFGANATGEVLFNFTSNANIDIFYLRRQSFDVFENNVWVNKTSFRLENMAQNLNGEELKILYMPKAANNLARQLAQTDQYGYMGLDKSFADIDPYSRQARIREYSDSFGPSYIPAPLNTSPDMISGMRPYLSYRGSILGNYNSRVVLNSTVNFYPETRETFSTAKELGLSWENYENIITNAYVTGNISNDLYNAILSQKRYYSVVTEYSDEMAQLAHQITDKYESDYDKAEAIVKYFEDNGYVYDLDYIPDDESIDYFLFESKRGSCTSYATAMTLMARIVGIPARYVEGFAVNEMNENGEYVVRDSCAHAFVEVLIPGMGWMTFDPTVPGYLDNIKKAVEGGNVDTDAIATFLSYFSRMILFLIVIAVVILFVLLDKILERFFRLRYKFTKPNEKVLLLYRRIIKLLEISSHKRLKGLTAGQLCEYARTERFADVAYITDLFTKVCFGGYEPTEAENLKAYEVYKECWKMLSHKPKIKEQLN